MSDNLESQLTKPNTSAPAQPKPNQQPATPVVPVVEADKAEDKDLAVALVNHCCRTLAKMSEKDRKRFLNALTSLYGEEINNGQGCKGGCPR